MFRYIDLRNDNPPADFMPDVVEHHRRLIWEHNRRPGETVDEYRARQQRALDATRWGGIIASLAGLKSHKES